MDGKRINVTGVSLGSVAVHGHDRPVVSCLVDASVIPDMFLLMLPTGRLGLPSMPSFVSVDGRIVAHPVSDDLRPVDVPWQIEMDPEIREAFDVLAVTSAPAGCILHAGRTGIIELSGVFGRARTPANDDEVMFQVGLWLAATQLATDSSAGFGHIRVAAGLAATVPGAVTCLQRTMTAALASLTEDGRARLLSVPLPRAVPEDAVRLIATGTPMRDIFHAFGPGKSTAASVWVLAVLARLVTGRRRGNGHSPATLLADWIGDGSAWWMWRALVIALASYEDCAAVSVLESRADGALGSLFWWIHELVEGFEGLERAVGRSATVEALRGFSVMDRQRSAPVPVLDFAHALLSHPSQESMESFCGASSCRACRVTSMILSSPWERSAVAAAAVWSVLAMSDTIATQRGYQPGDEQWRKDRHGIIALFVDGVSNHLAPPLQWKAA